MLGHANLMLTEQQATTKKVGTPACCGGIKAKLPAGKHADSRMLACSRSKQEEDVAPNPRCASRSGSMQQKKKRSRNDLLQVTWSG